MAEHGVLVLGARGVVGMSLVEQLQARGHAVTAVSRQPQPATDARWIQADLEDQSVSWSGRYGYVVHAAPLWLLARHIDALARCGVKRLVAFSSTSAASKAASPDAAERRLAARLAEAEQECSTRCNEAGIAWTLFRPTLIYGYARDHNIMSIARFIGRFGFFPLAAPARGLRQPVHADDLADACVRVLDREVTFASRYELVGGETLPYAEMVGRIFRGLGRQPRILLLPVSLYRAALLIAGRVGKLGLSAAMADRMQQDLCFDDREARADFGYRPQRFLTVPERDLGVARL